MLGRRSGASADREWERAVLFGLVEAPPRRQRLVMRLKRGSLALSVALLATLGAPVAAALANTYYVSNANDTGAGSLRAAITAANGDPGADTIQVAPGVGALTIAPQTPLPSIKGQVLLNGGGLITINDTFTKGNGLVLASGSGASTLEGVTVAGASAAGILVSSAGNVLEGLTVGDSSYGLNLNGIVIESGNNTIGGSSAADTFTSARHDGILVQAPNGGTANDNQIGGNLIGTDAVGDGGLGNGVAGIALTKAASGNLVSNNTIGGSGGEGVLVAGAGTGGNQITGNYIGLVPSGPDGSVAVPNKDGIAINSGAANDTFTLNVVGDNSGDGVLLTGSGTSGNVLTGNLIGTDSGGDALGNSLDGVLIQRGASGNTVGGLAAGDGNTIAYNLKPGVQLSGSTTTEDALFGNLIFASGPNRSGPGIELVKGADGDQAPPAITSITSSGASITTITGTGASDATIQAFANPSCTDPEGRSLLGTVEADGSGTWTMQVNAVKAGTGVTAAQTTPSSESSQFSSCRSAP